MQHKIRILFTIPNFKTAGSQYVLLALMRGVDKESFECFVAVEKFPNTFSEDIPKSHCLHLPRTGNIWKDAIRFSKALKQYNIDMVHSWDYKSDFCEVIGARMAFVPLLYTKKNSAWSKRWFLKSVLANYIVYDHPEMSHRFFNHFLLRHKVTFIPHGVDTVLFKPSKEEKPKLNFNLCCIGNINENKNQLFLVRALLHLPNKFHLYLYGHADPKYLVYLQKVVEENKLQPRVHFMGFVENRDLPEVLQQHDLFVLASKKEGLPVSVLEALACGLPVLCSDSGGGTHYIFKNNQGGKVFFNDDMDCFIKYVLEFINNPVYYQEKMKEALDRAQNFKLDLEVNSYNNLYHQIVR